MTFLAAQPTRDLDRHTRTLQAADRNWLLPILTFVVWAAMVVAAAIGIALPYERFKAASKPPEPMAAVMLDIELVPDRPPMVLPRSAPPPPNAPPPVPKLAPLPVSPPVVPVVAATPAIAFAVPIDAPAPVVEPAVTERAFTDAPVVAQPAITQAVPQPLIFGQGEGRQPAPDYPRQALRTGQEGVVVVQFTVSENGLVLKAGATIPSPWPLLNEAAVRVVKSRWRFAPGALREYQVSIRFELSN